MHIPIPPLHEVPGAGAFVDVHMPLVPHVSVPLQVLLSLGHSAFEGLHVPVEQTWHSPVHAELQQTLALPVPTQFPLTQSLLLVQLSPLGDLGSPHVVPLHTLGATQSPFPLHVVAQAVPLHLV